MPELSLFNAAGRDAQVSAESVRIPVRIRRLDRDGKQCQSMRILRGTFDRGLAAVEQIAVANVVTPVTKVSPAAIPDLVAHALIAGDPEIDAETVGMFLRPGESKRVYVDPGGRVQHVVQHMEIVRNPDGSEKERRVKGLHAANVHIPLRWSGKLIPRKEAIAKYVSPGRD